MKEWTEAISERVADECYGNNDFPEDAGIIEKSRTLSKRILLE